MRTRFRYVPASRPTRLRREVWTNSDSSRRHVSNDRARPNSPPSRGERNETVGARAAHFEGDEAVRPQPDRSDNSEFRHQYARAHIGSVRWHDLTPSHETPINLANRENFPIWITHLVLKGKETTAAIDRDLENEIFSYPMVCAPS
jgi:hypothetical protein